MADHQYNLSVRERSSRVTGWQIACGRSNARALLIFVLKLSIAIVAGLTAIALMVLIPYWAFFLMLGDLD